MSSRNQVVMAGVFAVAIALAAIAGAVYLLPSPSQSRSSTVTTTGGSSQTLQKSAAGEQGTLSVLLTDPPTVPANVTAIYVTYSNVAVHVGKAGNQTGWTNANVTGTIDLMKMVNVSSTIAVVKVSTGVYNALRFNVSSALVTFNGENYTAFVPKAELTVIIPGGIQVNSTSTAGAIIDMHPTVLNIGSKSTPEFIVDTAASVFSVPPTAITKAVQHIGAVMGIGNQGWWQHISEQYTADISITGATVSNDSLSVTVENTGNQSVALSTLTLSPVGSECAAPQSSQNHMALPLCLTGSAIFLVQNDSTLKSVSSFLPQGFGQPGSNHGERGGRQSNSTATPPSFGNFGNFTSFLGSTGYTLAAGQSVTLTYSGSISFGFAFGNRTPPGVLSGDQYQVVGVGLGALAETVVVAG